MPRTLFNHRQAAKPLVRTVTGTHNETETNGTIIILCDTSGGAVTVNLPTAVGNTAVYLIKKITAPNTVTVDAFTTQTIDDALTAVLNVKDESITVIPDNVNMKLF